MHFYDKSRNPLDIQRILSDGGLFLIAQLLEKAGDKYLVGLFIEDDGNYFLESVFDPAWLLDLMVVSKCAYDTQKNLTNVKLFGTP